ncbi:ring-1,2-phenylacetyl-CoA epoxidase subunit PaaD [Paracoccus isoporae]|uniref:Ring-1,2-phenylacetyl-CoA epoxidase subunit PaaD n=1 Tax=Paracoccus isoporae TaxID=591205 RepID=A0A1G7ARR3_9RHOB|nr:1,2-phenylacetyl-CoA epoxidase subunit PaaD [Paracoccus isoporae]SDE17227.1 ring-1,2-phenylacetyl-CoA epoxidase subunit PaaD [Paracoccus isoporae]
MRPAVSTIWDWLAELPDPEIPAISLTDLGIIRDVGWQGETLVVTVTPTYSGCPATSVINLDIETHLRGKGIEDLRLERRLSPAWTTDWISDQGREKLREYGIAPPIAGTAPDGHVMARIGALGGNLAVPCPRCGATDTRRVSQFGSTPCKASWVCNACLEPFDYFKCH